MSSARGLHQDAAPGGPARPRSSDRFFVGQGDATRAHIRQHVLERLAVLAGPKKDIVEKL
ncbi:MAG: hypothetical protein AAB290_03095 [Candidatus Eisenbacteria bacterium]